jgi:hypothetical protein
MNKETIEAAADKWKKYYAFPDNQIVASESFHKGVKWQEQKEANNAIEFADWLCENGWSSSPPMWVNGEASDDYLGRQGTYTELTTHQLYCIWKLVKNK